MTAAPRLKDSQDQVTRPGLHFGRPASDPETQRQLDLAHRLGFSTVIDRGDAEALEQLLRAAEARGLV